MFSLLLILISFIVYVSKLLTVSLVIVSLAILVLPSVLVVYSFVLSPLLTPKVTFPIGALLHIFAKSTLYFPLILGFPIVIITESSSFVTYALAVLPFFNFTSIEFNPFPKVTVSNI